MEPRKRIIYRLYDSKSLIPNYSPFTKRTVINHFLKKIAIDNELKEHVIDQKYMYKKNHEVFFELINTWKIDPNQIIDFAENLQIQLNKEQTENLNKELPIAHATGKSNTYEYDASPYVSFCLDPIHLLETLEITKEEILMGVIKHADTLMAFKTDKYHELTSGNSKEEGEVLVLGKIVFNAQKNNSVQLYKLNNDPNNYNPNLLIEQLKDITTLENI